MAVFLKALGLPALLMSLVSASPATIVNTPTVPVDLVARAKFPADKPEAVDALAYLNKVVNANIAYVSDQEHYGQPITTFRYRLTTRAIARISPSRRWSC
jgi:predicted transglutaminase-like cysteine proteinase